MKIFGYNIKIVAVFVFAYLLIMYGGTNAVDARFYQNRDADWIDTFLVFIGVIILYFTLLFSSSDYQAKERETSNKKAEWQKQKVQMNHFRKRYDELKKSRR